MVGQSKLAAAACAYSVVVLSLPVLIKVWRSRSEGKNAENVAEQKKIRYEFNGPAGACGIMIGLPAVTFFIYYACNKDFVMPGANLSKLVEMPCPNPARFLSLRAVGLSVGWFAFQVLLERCLPAKIVEGVNLEAAGGTGKLKYRINGHSAFWVSLGGLTLLASGALGGKPGEYMAILYDEFPALAGASLLFSLGLSSYLYASSFRQGALLARGGDTGNPWYDFFIGRELNPRLGSFDLKEFCELRPGLIGWMALNMGMASKQYMLRGSLTAGMILVLLYEGLYVWDALYHEESILSTMDITTDGFGFMLAWGDLAWLPFTYGVQARYLVDHDPGLPPWMLMMSVVGAAGGYYIFRSANAQKDQFRRDPTHESVKHLQVMDVQNLQTGRPSKLLISGWWGRARKINYTGDWLMSYSWCMPCGCPWTKSGCVLTYFYPIYFAALLIQRAGRDDHFCKEKYGEAWTEYKKRVPYIFVPFLL